MIIHMHDHRFVLFSINVINTKLRCKYYRGVYFCNSLLWPSCGPVINIVTHSNVIAVIRTCTYLTLTVLRFNVVI